VSSLTYLVTLDLDGTELRTVVKVAPPGLPPRGNRDVLRQARLLRALETESSFPTPAVYFADAGDPPLFAMSYVPGDNYEPRVDVVEDPPTPDLVRERAYGAVATLALMHSVEPTALGLGGEPVMVLADEVQRWARLAATAPPLDGLTKLGQRLAGTIPANRGPVLVHGDFRLGNLLFEGSRVTTVFDWEIWSVGDPRFDLAWLLMMTDPIYGYHDFRGEANELSVTGLPSPMEQVSRYEELTGTTMDDLKWFLAFARFKTASISSSLLKYNASRTTRDEKLDRTRSTLGFIVQRGHDLLDGKATA
jgi:aminoglycoside phosphotransferase (APT) family kinase protein